MFASLSEDPFSTYFLPRGYWKMPFVQYPRVEQGHDIKLSLVHRSQQVNFEVSTPYRFISCGYQCVTRVASGLITYS